MIKKSQKKTPPITMELNTTTTLHLQKIFELIEEAIILLSTKDVILYINPAALSLYGWKKDVVGKIFPTLLKKSKLPSPLPKKLSRSLQNIDLEIFQSHNNIKKNRKIISWKCFPYKIFGKNYGRLLLGKDITETKKLEKKIFELDTIIAQIPGNLYWYSKDFVYLGCNENSAKSLNMTREEAVGQSFKTLMKKVKTTDASLVDTFVTQGKEVLRTGKPLLDIEEPPFYGHDRKLRYYLANKVPLCNQGGEVYGVIGISTDITYRKELEKNLHDEREKALAASKSKSEFITNMSHDIRTPIAGILGVVQNMLNNAAQTKALLSHPPKETLDFQSSAIFNKLLMGVKQDGELLMSATNELLQLCNEILEVVRLESRKIDAQPEPFLFRDVIQHNVDLLQPVARHKELQLITDIDTNIPTYLSGLHNYLDRTLLNLISNALKFTNTGWVKVSATLIKKPTKQFKKGDLIQVRILIEDSGIGIPNDKFETIFEPFSRLTPAYEGLYKGAGLGLYTVKQYIKAMDGKIDIKSKVGAGTYLCLTLPFTVAAPTKQINSAVNLSTSPKLNTKTSSQTFTPAKCSISILLVEDNQIAARAAAIILNTFNCSIDIAYNGTEAVAKAQNHTYHLIVMDVGLPDFSGIEATKKIRALPDKIKSQVPIIALTGHADNGEKRHECLAAGMQEVLSKPLQQCTLETAFQRLIYKPAIKPKTSTTKKTLTPITLSTKIIDWEGCKQMCQYNSKLTNELLSILNKDLKRAKEVFKIAYKNKNIELLRIESHRIRGGVSYLKLPQLEKALAVFHKVLKTIDSQHFSQLEKVYISLQKAIDVFLAAYICLSPKFIKDIYAEH